MDLQDSVQRSLQNPAEKILQIFTDSQRLKTWAAKPHVKMSQLCRKRPGRNFKNNQKRRFNCFFNRFKKIASFKTCKNNSLVQKNIDLTFCKNRLYQQIEFMNDFSFLGVEKKVSTTYTIVPFFSRPFNDGFKFLKNCPYDFHKSLHNHSTA